jgi:hypothetical protein
MARKTTPAADEPAGGSRETPRSTTRPPQHPAAPSFGICAGVADELARTGRAIDPFTGQLLEREA